MTLKLTDLFTGNRLIDSYNDEVKILFVGKKVIFYETSKGVESISLISIAMNSWKKLSSVKPKWFEITSHRIDQDRPVISSVAYKSIDEFLFERKDEAKNFHFINTKEVSIDTRTAS